MNRTHILICLSFLFAGNVSAVTPRIKSNSLRRVSSDDDGDGKNHFGIAYNPWGLFREKGGKYYGGEFYYFGPKGGGLEIGGTYYNKKHEQAIDVGIANDNVEFGTPYWKGFNVHLIKYFRGSGTIGTSSYYVETKDDKLEGVKFGLMLQYSKRNFFADKDGKGNYRVISERAGLALHLSYKLGTIPMVDFYGSLGAAVGTWDITNQVSNDPDLENFFHLRKNPYVMPIMQAGINIGFGN